MVETQRRIIAITAPTVPVWAVFTSEEGEPEIWTERVHLWAHIKTGLSQDGKDSEAFLGNEVPSDEFKIEAMVLDEGNLVVVSESQFVFMGYSTTEQADAGSEWEGKVKSARRLYRRRLYGEE
jgi:hypothetical protein